MAEISIRRGPRANIDWNHRNRSDRCLVFTIWRSKAACIPQNFYCYRKYKCGREAYYSLFTTQTAESNPARLGSYLQENSRLLMLCSARTYKTNAQIAGFGDLGVHSLTYFSKHSIWRDYSACNFQTTLTVHVAPFSDSLWRKPLEVNLIREKSGIFIVKAEKR